MLNLAFGHAVWAQRDTRNPSSNVWATSLTRISSATKRRLCREAGEAPSLGPPGRYSQRLFCRARCPYNRCGSDTRRWNPCVQQCPKNGDRPQCQRGKASNGRGQGMARSRTARRANNRRLLRCAAATPPSTSSARVFQPPFAYPRPTPRASWRGGEGPAGRAKAPRRPD